MKQFTLSEDRIVEVKNVDGCYTVVMKQNNSDVKYVVFSPNRWAQFRESLEDIEANLQLLRDDAPVAYKHAIGGGFFVSITSGFYCIDIRKFFVPVGESDPKPTRRGLAIRIREWDQLKKIVEDINTTYPTLGTALPCYYGNDHLNQQGAIQCADCNPFGLD